MATRFGTVVRVAKPDKFWRKRKILRLTAHFSRRRRNCYSIAIRGWIRAMANSTKAERLKVLDAIQLRETRLDAACAELGTDVYVLIEGLIRCNILLDKEALTNLAIWEPRTFKCLALLAKTKFNLDPPKRLGINLSPIPEGVITRGML